MDINFIDESIPTPSVQLVKMRLLVRNEYMLRSVNIKGEILSLSSKYEIDESKLVHCPECDGVCMRTSLPLSHPVWWKCLSCDTKFYMSEPEDNLTIGKEEVYHTWI